MEHFFDLFLPAGAARLDIPKILDEKKLVHLHPHWFVEDVVQDNPSFLVSLRDYATDKIFPLDLSLTTSHLEGDPTGSDIIMRVSFNQFAVRELLFFIDQETEKTRVRICFTSEQFEESLEEEILLWVRAIQEYLRLYLTTTPRTLFFRAMMNRMILRMNPSQRRICLMIAKITVIEIVVIIILVVGYVYFGRT
jgi:hypothetical protein